uniref:Uncharacterized protein n=1 Tax=Malurus cyaneus samueli TaxID=2593467 RepID=A0A8C5TF15_9PASS
IQPLLGQLGFAVPGVVWVRELPQNRRFFPRFSAPVAAAVRSHFNECPDSHRHFCFHGTCRFLVQEDRAACKTASGLLGTRGQHRDGESEDREAGDSRTQGSRGTSGTHGDRDSAGAACDWGKARGKWGQRPRCVKLVGDRER